MLGFHYFPFPFTLVSSPYYSELFDYVRWLSGGRGRMISTCQYKGVARARWGCWGEDGDILIGKPPCFITALHEKQLSRHQIKVLLSWDGGLQPHCVNRPGSLI
jgi:hypothetical protein